MLPVSALNVPHLKQCSQLLEILLPSFFLKLGECVAFSLHELLMEISRDDLQRFVSETSSFPELPHNGFGSSLRVSFAMAPTKRRHVSFATCVMLTCSRVRGDSSKEGLFLAVVLVTYFSGHGEPMACSCSWKIRGISLKNACYF